MAAPIKVMNYSFEKADVKFDTSFTCCGCNRTPNSVHWSHSGHLLYAARNGIAVVSVNVMYSTVQREYSTVQYSNSMLLVLLTLTVTLTATVLCC